MIEILKVTNKWVRKANRDIIAFELNVAKKTITDWMSLCREPITICTSKIQKRALTRTPSRVPGVPLKNLYVESADRRQEQEPIDWEDVPFLPEVSAPFVPFRPPRKMRSLISVQVSEPHFLKANRFRNMRALVPKRIVDTFRVIIGCYQCFSFHE
ncbi:hypothetical protein TNCV_3974031 [Trichonephila clavipes]|nr:hypothetical protein TNCV_3974031 [Trichonephila clavipes]